MSIIEKIKQNIEDDGDKIALVSEDRNITYRELFYLSGKYKQLILNHTKGRKETIGVCFSRCIEYVCCVIGILRAGCSFMPISKKNVGLDNMIQLSNANYIIVDNANFFFTMLEKKVVILQGMDTALNSIKELDQDILTGKNDAVYLLFTSGTTGIPKGIMIHYEALNNLLDHILDRKLLKPRALFLANTAFTFDISILEILYPLINHDICYVVSESQQENPRKIVRLLENNKFDFVQFTPSHLMMLMYEDNSLTCLQNVSVIFIGGEKMPFSLLRLLQNHKGLKIFNVYGPTEATIWVSCGDLTNSDHIHVGTPIANMELYIMDDEYNIVEEGELFIAGLGTARGYVENENATNEKFIEINDKKRLYRTGDYARKKNENYIILGRKDNQIKLRGHRIELEDVENGVMKCNGIRQCVILEIWGKLLACYISEKKHEENCLRQEAKEYLTEFMLPDTFIKFNSFPLTTSGKIDRKLLSEEVRRNMKINEKICSIINEFSIRKCQSELTFEELGLDSIEFISLLVKLERVFKIEFDDEALLQSNYKCLGDFIKFVSTMVKNIE